MGATGLIVPILRIQQIYSIEYTQCLSMQALSRVSSLYPRADPEFKLNLYVYPRHQNTTILAESIRSLTLTVLYIVDVAPLLIKGIIWNSVLQYKIYSVCNVLFGSIPIWFSYADK